MVGSCCQRCIEVGPVGNTESAAEPVISGNVAIYNGTSLLGLTKTVESKLLEKFGQLVVVYKGNASRGDFSDTIVVDLNGSMAQQAAVIAGELGAKVEPLPAGEQKPDPAQSDGKSADILIIAGSNFK